MTDQQALRLRDIRAGLMHWSALTDTSNWEATFFFQLLDEKNRELAAIRKS